MAAQPDDPDRNEVRTPKRTASSNGIAEAEPELEEDEDEEEEPKLKYVKLTSSLGSVYRNGDATSSFAVAGDKMVWHNSTMRREILLMLSLI